jgi:hypothetical protein
LEPGCHRRRRTFIDLRRGPEVLREGVIDVGAREEGAIVGGQQLGHPAISGHASMTLRR